MLSTVEKPKPHRKQKNFGVEPVVADAFELFCGERGLSQGRAISAAMLQMMRVPAEERERWMLELEAHIRTGSLDNAVAGKLGPGADRRRNAAMHSPDKPK